MLLTQSQLAVALVGLASAVLAQVHVQTPYASSSSIIPNLYVVETSQGSTLSKRDLGKTVSVLCSISLVPRFELM